MSLRWEFVDRHSVFLAASLTKVLWGLLLVVGLLAIVYWMLRSIGIDRNTPPSMVWRKVLAFVRSFYRPLLIRGQWKKATQLEESQKLDGAVDIYVQIFDYDGLLSSQVSIAIHNDRCLEHVEEICKRVGFPYPAERINRLREDIYDYFLVKLKYLSPSDYDGTPLIRAENEHRFFDKLNLRQEEQFIEDFREFFESFSTKLKRHIASGAPPIEAPVVSTASYPDMAAGTAGASVSESYGMGSFDGAGFGNAGMSQPVSQPIVAPLPAAPGIFGSNRVEDAPLPPPPDLFGGSGFSGEANPFALDDPRMPHHEATGRLHKLPGVADDTPFHQGLRDVELPLQEEPTRQGPIPKPPVQPTLRPVNPGLGGPQPTGGFPGLSLGGTPAAPAFPQPTGGFPGLGQGAPTPAVAQVSPSAFPQPTGGFPGFAAQGNPFSAAPSAAPSTPQPTGGFPGFAKPTHPAPTPAPGTGSQPPGAPNFPQPTGGFPGFAGGSAAPAPSFPQATGGFPGFGSNIPISPASPAPASFPQPTGGFPGFGQGGNVPTSGAPSFPQPTGGFPGFGGAPPRPGSNAPAGEGKK